ncbi:MAG: C_GCAxxG_C_C family protein [Proteobacteria bacterium]|nr:C_GCAxxG_C_C family protein [Pseudomonadota bacterium]
MEEQEKIEFIRERARKNFSQGYNCAECVLEAALASGLTGMPPEALKLATGFGGGVGLYGDTCGAITGAILAVGAMHGRNQLPAGEDRKEVAKKAAEELYGKPGLYRLFNLIPNHIEKKYGHTLCRDITGQWRDTWLCREHALHCREIITEAATLAAELICSDKTEMSSKPFGENVENLVDEGTACSGGSD